MLCLESINIFNYQVVKMYHSQVVQSFEEQFLHVGMFRTSCKRICTVCKIYVYDKKNACLSMLSMTMPS